MGASNPRLSTGLRFLDQQLGGGLESGGLLAVVAPADSQIELLFEEFSRENPFLLVSTLTDDAEELYRKVGSDGSRDDLTVAYSPPSELLGEPDALDDLVAEEGFVVVDAMNVVETGDRAEYLTFLNGLKARMREVNGVAVLHCLAEQRDPPHRVLTKKRADHVWRLEMEFQSSEIKNRLLVTKSRSRQTISEPLPLEFGDTVRVDTSRSIA